MLPKHQASPVSDGLFKKKLPPRQAGRRNNRPEDVLHSMVTVPRDTVDATVADVGHFTMSGWVINNPNKLTYGIRFQHIFHQVSNPAR